MSLTITFARLPTEIERQRCLQIFIAVTSQSIDLDMPRRVGDIRPGSTASGSAVDGRCWEAAALAAASSSGTWLTKTIATSPTSGGPTARKCRKLSTA